MVAECMFQYHTFLHHSQTNYYDNNSKLSFSTIRFYIILKQPQNLTITKKVSVPYVFTSFSNTPICKAPPLPVSVPYVFTSFSNSLLAITATSSVSVPYVFTSVSNSTYVLRRLGSVSVPYVFTSFSNLKFKNEPPSFAQNKVLKHI